VIWIVSLIHTKEERLYGFCFFLVESSPQLLYGVKIFDLAEILISDAYPRRIVTGEKFFCIHATAFTNEQAKKMPHEECDF
jgi:hypothetical protein